MAAYYPLLPFSIIERKAIANETLFILSANH
jgi:hypothetical protein